MPLGELGSLVAKIGLDTSGLTRDVAEAKEKLSGGFEESQRRVGRAMVGIGAAAATLGVALQAEAQKDEEAHIKLKLAIENTGASYRQYGERIEEAVGHQANLGRNAADTQSALAQLTLITGDAGKALDLMSLASEIAAYRHISLSEAAALVGRGVSGNARVFKQFGVQITDTEKATGNYGEALRQVHEKIKGVDTEIAGTFGGHIQALRAHVENLAAAWGAKLGPALITAGPLLMGVGAIIESGIIPKIQALGASALRMGAEALTGLGEWVASMLGIETSTIAAGTAINVALGIGVIGAFALLITGIYMLATHWDTVWGTIKRVISNAIDFIKEHTLILSILFGPVIGIISFFASNWDTIWGAIKATVAAAVDFIEHHMHFIITAIKAVGTVVGDIAGIFTGSHKKMGDSAKETADGIEAAGGRTEKSEKQIAAEAKKMADDVDAANKKAKEAVDAFTESVEGAAGQEVSLDQATVGLAEKLDGLAAAFRTNGTTMDVHTEKGRANHQAIDDTVTSIQKHIEKLQESGATMDGLQGAYDTDVANLKKVMSQAGYTSEQIAGLISQYHLTPEEISTSVKLAGVAEAERNAAAIKQLYQDLKTTLQPIDVVVKINTPTGHANVRAEGGPVEAGVPYVVGERRPELFVPNVDGHIVPRVPATPARASGAASTAITYAPSVSIDASGGSDIGMIEAAVARMLADHSADLVRLVRSA